MLILFKRRKGETRFLNFTLRVVNNSFFGSNILCALDSISEHEGNHDEKRQGGSDDETNDAGDDGLLHFVLPNVTAQPRRTGGLG